MPEQKRMCREAWRDYGAGLLAQRALMPSSNEFGAWVKVNGLDTGPASNPTTRSNAMWLAENWSALVETKAAHHNPTNLRNECRKLGHAWAFDQRESKAAAKRGAKPQADKPKRTGWVDAVRHHLGELPTGFGHTEISCRKHKRPEIEAEFGQAIPSRVELDSQQARDIAAAVQRCYDKQKSPESPAQAVARIDDLHAQVSEKDKARFDRLLEETRATMAEQFELQVEQRVAVQVVLERERLTRAADQHEAEAAALLAVRMKHIDSLMTQEEFKIIRGCLHPDKHPGSEQARYSRAFNIFSELEKTVNTCLPAAELRKRGWVNPFKRGG